MSEFSELVGQTLTSVDVGEYEIIFNTKEGNRYKQYHYQDCCEGVYVEDICGDILDILDSPVIVAEESSSRENPEDAKPETIKWQDSFTWTFYKIDTAKGGITIRWYGESNGYYSESVDFDQINK